MKVILATIVITGFIGVAVFGFLSVNHESHANGSCIAVTAQGGAPCPGSSNIFAILDFHFNALKTFSRAVLGGPSIYSLLLFSYLFAPAAAFIRDNLRHLALAHKSIASGFAGIQIEESYFESERPFMRWQALHDNSPSIM